MFTGGPLSYPAFFLVLICMLLSLPADSRAAFEVVSHDAVADPAQRRTAFRLTFNQPPDFVHDSFQHFYDAAPDGGDVGFVGEGVAIIRGAEIRFGDTIPIRDSLNPTGEELPNAEGWGDVLGEVGFVLDGQALAFIVPWAVLRETDDRFGYHVFAFEHGELTSQFTFVHPRVLVPLPPALPGGASLLAAAAVAARTRRGG